MRKTDTSQSTTASRRRFLVGASCAIGAITIGGTLPRTARADDLPHLATDDPTAKALNYTEDATKAPAPHQDGQACANCNFYHGGSTGYGPCDLFTGKAVSAKGWCAGYAKKA
ncbi:MAG TPA: high-potential iron-sulfur protein [Rudaea sp.]|nr:high-potential iron-sulfur protein [Rudaea sp.]